MELPRDCPAALAFFVSPARTLRPETTQHRKGTANKVGVRDIWDRGPTFQVERLGPVKLPWLLLVAVGLLSAEWLTRKLLRLA